MNDDLTLLREYARGNSEDAFAALVSRYVNLVYSVALRQVRDPHLAEEITQAVFIILARKADKFGPKTILPGWLCRTARYASANALTVQRRRQQREQEAYMQSILNEAEPMHEETWNQIAPLLDGALEKLGQKDHDAVVLRFFENRNFAEVGAAMGASEDAAKMRVNRALDKLRKFFTKRGVSSTTAIIAGTISANSVQAAPVALAKSVTAMAIAKGATASISTLTLIKGALKIMAWTKMKTAIVVGVVVLLATGATTIFVMKADQSPPTFYSLLENPPVICKAAFEKEIAPKMLPPGFPASAQKQSRSFYLDGENYRVDYGGYQVGKFNNVLWTLTGNRLSRFDLKWNKVASDSTAVARSVMGAKIDFYLLLSFGITTIRPENVVWSNNHNQFTFQDNDGNKFSVDFTEDKGQPMIATIRDGKTGAADGIVVYRYDPSFFGGKLPVEFTSYLGDLTNEDTKVGVIHLQSLEIWRRHLPPGELDPDKLFKSNNTNYVAMFYSNNIPYWTDTKGKVRRILTPEENAKEIQRMKASQKK